ncbi:flippase [Thermococcus sp.]|uniref:flippase n=1 Tax=Thermococcus sp. TaxID=35749 RepID=UPI0025DEAE17|nr:flippase [Thermococcus sp.]
MSDEVVTELGRAARGGAIALVGMVVSAVLGFLVRAVIGRYFGPKEYGTYNLAMTVFTITLVVVMLGFPMGIQRQVSYFLNTRREKTPELISTGLILITLTSTGGLLVLEVIKGILPAYIGGGELFTEMLGVLALALPLNAVFNIMIATTQGFGRVREFLFYGKIGMPLTYFLLTVIVILVAGKITYVPIAFLTTYLILLTVLTEDLLRKNILPGGLMFSKELAKLLVLFSIPLMASNLVAFIMTWTDTLMLGHFLGDKIVGIYNAAGPITRFIPVFLASFTVIYTALTTGFYSRGEIEKIRKFYVSITKWVVLLTFPLFILIVAYPIPVLRTFFGEQYVSAWKPMIILAVGFMFHSIVGPNGLTLITMGKPSEDMKGNLIGATLNIVLNYILIPLYGMVGASIATAVSYVVANIYKSIVLANRGIHPFEKNYVKILITGIAMTGVALFLKAESIFSAVMYTFLVSLTFYAVILVSGAFDKVDVDIIKLAEKKFGVRAGLIARLIKRFSS